MTHCTFAPGFRLSALDVVILFVGGVAAAAFTLIDGWIGLAIAFVVAHFFLFCNVLRMSRPMELGWAGVFAVLAVSSAAFGLLSWTIVFACSIVLTLFLATIEVRRPSYHGIGWRLLNPRLPEWWKTQTGSAAAR